MTKGQVWRRGGGDLCRRRPPGGVQEPGTHKGGLSRATTSGPGHCTTAPGVQAPGRLGCEGAKTDLLGTEPPGPLEPPSRLPPRSAALPGRGRCLCCSPSCCGGAESREHVSKDKGTLYFVLNLELQGPSAGVPSSRRLFKLKSIHPEMSTWSKIFSFLLI